MGLPIARTKVLGTIGSYRWTLCCQGGLPDASNGAVGTAALSVCAAASDAARRAGQGVKATVRSATARTAFRTFIRNACPIA